MKFCFGDRCLEFNKRPLVMGILNVTPDSFSDGGECVSVESAVEKARRIFAEGADLLDVGGESTRPGYAEVDSGEEVRRVYPVITALRRTFGEAPVISVDTTKPEVACAALEAGANIVNDVSALKNGGQQMCRVLRKYRAGCILMHSERLIPGEDVMEQIAFSLERSLEYAVVETGLEREYFMLDTGIGFGKSLEQNLACCVDFRALRRLERPVMIGASRKSFLEKITSRNVDERDFATTAVSAVATLRGVNMLRVHNVAAAVDAAAVAAAFEGIGG